MSLLPWIRSIFEPYLILGGPYLEIVSNFQSKRFLMTYFFYFSYSYVWRILATFVTVSHQHLCLQNDYFTVKTLYNWQIFEIAVKCEKLNRYTWNFVRVLVFIGVLRLCGNILQFLLFSFSSYFSNVFKQ